MATNKCKPIPELSAKDTERFWSLVDKRGPDECWPWLAGKSDRGYGKFSICRDGTHSHLRANRVAIFLATGVDPFPLFACHSCDFPPCSNPNHLFPGDLQDNSDDMVRKGRAASGDRNAMRLYPEKVLRGDDHPFRKNPELMSRGADHWTNKHPEWIQGERNPRSRLTDAIVIEMRRRRKNGDKLIHLAMEYGVSRSTAGKAISGKMWSHIPF